MGQLARIEGKDHWTTGRSRWFVDVLRTLVFGRALVQFISLSILWPRDELKAERWPDC
jgi:hypothetical protein